MDYSNQSVDSSKAMTKLHYTVGIICFLMNMLDGMDVLIISYTAPAIAKAWSVSPQVLGVVFSSGLVGMTIGTLILAPYADRIGRKNLILISAIIMGACIYLTSFATNVTSLMFYRFISGLGIGCMLATTATLAAEYTPAKAKDYWVSYVVSGYPVGAVISGLIASKVIPSQGWEQMFKYAGMATLVTVPIIIFFLAESIDFYLKRQPAHALEKVNNILSKIGMTPLKELPAKALKQSAIPIEKLLATEYRKPTIQIWIGLFMAFAALYFLTSWIPKLAQDAGLSLKLAIYAGTFFNIGAFFGILTQGYFSSKFGLKKTLGVIFLLTALAMASFGLFIGSDFLLVLITMLGFGIQGGFVGLYNMSARMYPTEFRSTGIGWAMGAGRIGGIVGPVLAGILIGAGFSISSNFLIFAVPALLAGVYTYYNSSKNVS